MPPDLPPAGPAPPPRLPVTIVTGFLGSGKTTLVNRILAQAAGLRVAVLVNELGDIAIDGALITGAGNEVVELANGCICCSIADDFAGAVKRVLRRRRQIDHLVIETTGIADPLPVALTLLRPEFRSALRIDGILSLADAEHFSLDQDAGRAALNQLRHADFVLLNKCDLVSPARVDAVEIRIRSVAPAAHIERTVRAVIPLPLILGAGLFAGAAEAEPEVHDHRAGDGFEAVSFVGADAFGAEAFQAFLEALPRGVFRAKGLLSIAEAGQHIFHLVGRRFTLDPAPAGAVPGNRLVLIGRGLDAGRLREDLEACVAAPVTRAAG